MSMIRISGFIVSNYKPLRLVFLVASDAVLILFAVIVATFLYEKVDPLHYSWAVVFGLWGILFGLHSATYGISRIYNVSFRYANISLTLKIVAVQTVYLLIAFFVLRAVFPGFWPPMVAVVHGLISTTAAVLLRILGLIYREVAQSRAKWSKEVLVYGAGDTGKSIVLAWSNSQPNGAERIRVVGFLDDDPNLKNKIIFGHKVLGGLERLEATLLKEGVNEIIVAIPSLGGERIRSLRDRCRSMNISVRMIPSFYEIYNRPQEDVLSSLRDIRFEDLLRRPKPRLPLEALERHFRDKKVLVIGGGGSIGSELVSQLLRLDCQKVVVADSSELNLHEMLQRFRGDSTQLEIHLVDAKERNGLAAIFAQSRPQIVFDAAAYKHVDLVESSPAVGVLNNIASMRNCADLAQEFGCEQFIFVSSDKAVRPANVMGATKRIGELYVQSLDAGSDTSMFVVRFGNVIGSSGSLIPSVISSVRRGEPVRITHPDMTRYFMLLPEAISLILTSCLYAKGGEAFVLDMGEPIKIIDLVEDLIIMLNESNENNIPIEFIGARPGEKIHEELFDQDLEQIEQRDGFYISKSRVLGFDVISGSVDEILSAIQNGETEKLPDLLRDTISLSSHSTAPI
jgi:FlaA1/EpsC-like NDP-sugar epimerase